MSKLQPSPMILLISSSGKLATYLIKEIIRSFATTSLVLSDYKPDRLEAQQKEIEKVYGGEVSTRLMNNNSIEQIDKAVKDMDYVIIPVAQRQPLIQQACIRHGISCIDLAVSEKHIDQVLTMHSEASKNKSLCMLAAGLFPGLSGIMAKDAFLKNSATIIDIGLLQTTDDHAGKSGIADMLELFSQKVEYVSQNQSQWINGFYQSKVFNFNAGIGNKKLRLANFIERKYIKHRLQIPTNYWSAFESEKFNQLIKWLRIFGLLKIFKKPTFRLQFAEFILKHKNKNGQNTMALIAQTDDRDKQILKFASDYDATAACVMAYIKLLINQPKEGGVHFPFDLFDLTSVVNNIQHKIIMEESK